MTLDFIVHLFSTLQLKKAKPSVAQCKGVLEVQVWCNRQHILKNKNWTPATRKQMKFRNDEKHLPYRLMPINMRCRWLKKKGKYEKIVLMLNVHKIHRHTTAWFIEASHTTDYLNNVMIILSMHCKVLKRSSGWVITSSRRFEEEALNPRENYFNFSKKYRKRGMRCMLQCFPKVVHKPEPTTWRRTVRGVH